MLKLGDKDLYDGLKNFGFGELSKIYLARKKVMM